MTLVHACVRSFPFNLSTSNGSKTAYSGRCRYAYYRHLRSRQPERLHFNAALPPANHVVLSCTLPEAHLEALRQIVQRFDPADFRTADVTLHTVYADPDRPAERRPMISAQFTIPRRHQQALTDAILASGAAGFSRAAAIMVLSDPDGPPRSADESRSR